MAINSPPLSGIALHGAPDAYRAAEDVYGSAMQCMRLEITDDVLQELVQSARAGKAPHLQFGRVPTLRYGGKTQVLTSTKSRREEVYSAADSSGGGLSFAGYASYKLIVEKAEQTIAATDAALETLKNNIASINQEKEARKTEIDRSFAGTPKVGGVPGKRRPPHLSQTPRSLPSSPSLAALKSPSLAAPTSAPASQTQSAAIVQALRKPLIHLLAIKPVTLQEVVRKVGAKKDDCLSVLQKIAKPARDDAAQWQLTDRVFKELDAWSFPYPSQSNRQAAIDNAIRAFDRLRVSKEDKLWQALLPKEERGKGKVLSRLNLTSTPMPTKPTTPLLKPKQLMKKVEGKKEKAEKPERAKVEKKKKKAVDDGPPPVKKTIKERKEEQRAAALERKKLKEREGKPLLTKAAQGIEAKSTPDKPTKGRGVKASDRAAGSARRTQTTKPKNPSPLSASPPVNASDFEEDHPIHKSLSATASPAKGGSSNSERPLKRKSGDLDHERGKHDATTKHQRRTDQAMSVKPRVGGTENIQSASVKVNGTSRLDRSLKRKAPELDSDTSRMSSPAKQRKIGPIDTTPRYVANGRGSPQSDESNSPPLALSFRQTLELSQKFNRYYERYRTLYLKLAGAVEPPTEHQREELLKMHGQLEKMKREIRSGAMRQ